MDGTPFISVDVRAIFIKSVYIKVYLPTHSTVVFIDKSWPPLSIIWPLENKHNFFQTSARESNDYCSLSCKSTESAFCVKIHNKCTFALTNNKAN